jgi:hypothetical protein
LKEILIGAGFQKQVCYKIRRVSLMVYYDEDKDANVETCYQPDFYQYSNTILKFFEVSI